jgi:transposase InsO family protein
VTETLFGSLKVERLRGMHFATRRQSNDEVIDWLQFYDRRRLHSTLTYLRDCLKSHHSDFTISHLSRLLMQESCT